MTFPNIITTTGSLGSGSQPGPWRAPNGSLYVLTSGSGASPFTLCILKSTDEGVTWAIMNDGGSPPDSGIGSAFVGTMVGAQIWTANNTGAGAVTQSFTPFDTTTDTWGSPTAVTTASATDQGPWSLFYRASDNKLILAPDGVASFGVPFGKLRCGYLVFDISSLSFVDFVPCGETGASAFDWSCIGLIAGAANECDFIFWVTGSDQELWRQSLSSGGVLGTKTLIDTSTGPMLGGAAPAACSDGTTAYVIWQPTNLTAKVYTAPTSTWVFTNQTLTIAGSELNVESVAIVVKSPKVFSFIVTGAGNVLTATDTGAGFGSLTSLGALPGSGFNSNVIWGNTLGSVAWGIVMIGGATNYFWEFGMVAAISGYASSGGTLIGSGSYASVG